MKERSVISLFCVFILIILQNATPTECVCESTERNLILTYNPKTRIHCAVNHTAATVPVLDYVHNISAMYIGRTGAALAFNYETGISYYIPPGSGKTWLSSRTSFEEYFGELPSQLELYNYGETHGVRFDSSSITDDIADVMVEFLATLSPEYSRHCEALATYIQISKTNGDYLKTSLIGFGDVMGKFDAPFGGNFKFMVEVYKGLGTFFEAIPGGMATLVRKNITLDMGAILTRKSGFHVLIYLIEQLSRDFEVGPMLAKTLNDPLNFFSIIDKFGGELEEGFEGFVHVVKEVVWFYHDKCSIATLEVVIRRYASSSLTNGTENAHRWRSNVHDLLQATHRLNLSEPLSDMCEMLKKMNEGTWMMHNVNMSKTLDVLIQICSCRDEASILKLLRYFQTSDQISAQGEIV